MPMPVNLLKASEVAELAALIRWGGYGFIILDTETGKRLIFLGTVPSGR